MASQLTLFGESTLNTKSTPRAYTRESKLSVGGDSKISTFHPAASSLVNYNGTISTISTTRLFCRVHMLPKRRRGFGVWSIFAFIIKRILGNKRIFPCSFGNKRMRLLTRVYGIALAPIMFQILCVPSLVPSPMVHWINSLDSYRQGVLHHRD